MLIIHNGSHVEPLQYFKELKIKTRVNGERSLSFLILGNDENYSLVETDSVIEYNGQKYRILKTNEKSRGEVSVKSVQCLHTLFDLIENDVVGTLNGSQTLNQVMSFIFANTGYTFDIVDSFAPVDLEEFGNDNSIALFQQALNLYGAEFDINDTHITIKQQIGNVTDFQFRYKHNIKTIEKNVEKVGNELKMSLKLKFAELKKAGYPYEVVNCGDSVFTIYEPMKIDVTNRIVEYDEYPLESKESEVTIANYQDTMTDVQAQFSTTRKQVNELFEGKRKLPFNVLDDATQRATESLNNALTELEFPEGLGIIARDPNDANRFLALRSNGLGITKDGGVTFKEAITADGFVLSAGAIGQLNANNIRIGTGTTFDTNYDPTTKETPNGAQAKADSAETNAKTHADTVAKAEADLAEVQAKAYADGIVSTEEQARIADAQAKLDEAKSHADAVALAEANLAETQAKAYADGIVSAEEQARIDDATQKLAEAKLHAETKASEAESAAKTYADTKLLNYVDSTTYNTDLSEIQNQIDGNITTWFYAYEPSLTNEPSVNWNTIELKNQHLGDIFYNTVSGYAYRFQLENTVYKWTQLQDNDIQKALSDASKAQDTADAKRRVFVATPTTPYDIGDLWTEGVSGDLKRCITARGVGGTFTSADWEVAVKYTDDARAIEAETNAKTHADQVAEAERLLAETNSKAYADGIVSAEEQRAIDDAQAKLTEAKNHANSVSSTAETNAKTHADSVAESERLLAETNAKAYADGIVTTEEQARINEAQANLVEAKSHADTVASTAETNAKAYRDLWAYPNTTEIDGGNIRTNTITANQIAAGAITANEIDTSTITIGSNFNYASGYDPTVKLQQDTSYNNVKINSTDGMVVTNQDATQSKVNGNGVEVRGGNITVYDEVGNLVMDGRGLNPLETSGWGITTGLTFAESSFTQNGYVEVRTTSVLSSTATLPVYLYFEDVSALGSSGRLYKMGSFGRFIDYDQVDSANKRIRVTYRSHGDLEITSKDYLHASSVDGVSKPSPSGTSRLQIKSGSVVLKNGKYVRFNNDITYDLPISVGFSDVDGWSYRVLYINGNGEIKHVNDGTTGLVVDENNIKKYPRNPRYSNMDSVTPDANAIVLGAILCGTDAKKPFNSYIFMHPDFRDERAIKVSTESFSLGQLSDSNVEKSILSASTVTYGSWAKSAITMSNGETYEIAVPIGKGKRLAIVSIATTDLSNAVDDNASFGATLHVGLKDPYVDAWQPKVSVGHGDHFIDGYVEDSYGKYIVSRASLGWSYRRIKDAFLKIGADGETYLHVVLHQYMYTETRSVRLGWYAL